MSSVYFPTLAGMKMEVTRTPRWSTKIHTSSSGREQRVARFSSPIVEFELKFDVLRQGFAGGSTTEATTLQDFFNARQGALDTFWFVDPLDGTTRTVRFKEDSLKLDRVVKGIWQAGKVVLVEVKP